MNCVKDTLDIFIVVCMHCKWNFMIPYFLISVYYITIFISSFDDFFQKNRESIIQALNIQDDAVLFAIAADIALFSAIVAIGCNISKALFTLNALEFGNIHKISTADFGELYKSTGSNKSVFLEVTLRLCIAVLFVILELILSNTVLVNGYNFFVHLGVTSTILFIFIIGWFYYNKRRFKSDFIDKKWRIWSQVQYWSGIVVSLLIFLLGWYSKSKNFNYMIIGLLTIFIFSSGLLIISIIINEFPENNNVNEGETIVVDNGSN